MSDSRPDLLEAPAPQLFHTPPAIDILKLSVSRVLYGNARSHCILGNLSKMKPKGECASPTRRAFPRKLGTLRWGQELAGPACRPLFLPLGGLLFFSRVCTKIEERSRQQTGERTRVSGNRLLPRPPGRARLSPLSPGNFLSSAGLSRANNFYLTDSSLLTPIFCLNLVNSLGFHLT